MTTWTWLGDHLAVDFANTVKVDEGVVELIGTVEEFDAWREAEPAPLPPTRFTAGQLAELRVLRDATGRLLRAAAEQQQLALDDVDLVNEAVRAGGVRRVLGRQPGSASHEASHEAGRGPTALAGVLAAAVVDLLARDDLANIAVCPAPGCGQVFHRSRPNQRWCSPGCGNRARVDRHRHRRSAPRPI